MSDGLQTFNGAVQLVTLCCDLYRLVQKVRRAKPEAQKWLEKIASLRTLAGEIQRDLNNRTTDRANGHEASRDGIAIEKCLKASVLSCRRTVVEMKSKLLPLRDIGDDFTINSLRESIRFVFNTDFIKTQEVELSWQVQNISVALHLLDHHDRRQDRALLRELALMLQRGLGQTRAASSNASLQDSDEEYASALQTPTRRPSSIAQRDDAEIQLPELDSDIDSIDSDNDIIEPMDGSASDYASIQSENRSRESVLQIADNPLMVAVKRRNLEDVRGLISTSSDDEVCVYDEDQWTVLHHAAWENSPKILDTLLQRPQLCVPEYLNKQNLDQQTALIEAAKRADRRRGLELVKLLLDRNCEVNTLDGEGRGALHWVLDRPSDPKKCCDQAANLLLGRGAELKPVRKTIDDKQLKQYPSIRQLVGELPPDSDDEDQERRGTLRTLFTRH